MENKNLSRISEILLMIIILIWGLGFVVTKIALDYGYSVHVINAARFIFGSIFLTLIFYKHIPNINKKLLLHASIAGSAMFIGFFFQTLGAAYTTVAKNGFITQLNMLFVPLLYLLIFKKRISFKIYIAVFIGLLGVLLLNYNEGEFVGLNKGDIFTLICAIAVAIHIVIGSYFQKKYEHNPIEFTLIELYSGSILAIIVVIFDFSIPNNVLSFHIWPLLFLGILNTGLGFLVHSFAMKYSNPTRVSIIIALEALVAVIGGLIILKQLPSTNIIIGGILIIIAVLITEIKLIKRKE